MLLSVIGLIIGSLITGALYLKNEKTPRHVISCSFAVVAKNSGGYYTANTLSPGYNDVKLAQDIAESVVFVIKSDRVLSEAIKKKHFVGINNDDIRNYLDISQYSDTQIVTLKLMWINAKEGLEIVQSICDVTPDILIETLNLGSVSVVDYPKDIDIVTTPVHYKYIPLTILVLLAIYLFFIFIRMLIHPTITDVGKTEEKLNGLQCFGCIPDSGEYFSNRPFSLEDTDNDFYQVKDSFISISYVIHNLVKREKNKCFFITSSEEDEGKTGVTANLAIELSKREHKVLAVDMDFKRPTLGSCFFESVDYGHSINAAYDGRVELADAIIPISENLHVLATRLERASLKIDNLLVEDLKEIFEAYDIVLLDAAPIGIVSDTAALNSIADKAIMIIRFDKVWIETINSNIRKLNAMGIEVCGSILTYVKSNFSSDYYAYKSSYFTRENSYSADRKSKKKSKKKLNKKPRKIAKKKSKFKTLFKKKHDEDSE